MNSTFSQILGTFKKNKMSENLKFSLVLNPLPPKKWPGALDHLAIGFVDNKCTKL
jgi:hypothetical protein